MCCACGWRGNHDDVKTFEYEREKVVHFKLDYRVIDSIVWQFYGIDEYEFAAVEDCKNNTCHEFTVDGDFDDSLKDDVANFRRTGEHGNLTNKDVLNVLCQDGWLDPGVYLVEVAW
jgi:hypothetical protein